MKYLLLLILSSCGMHVHVDPIETKPIVVNHYLNINYDLVSSYCAQKCTATPTVDQTACSDACFHDFVDVLNHVTTPNK